MSKPTRYTACGDEVVMADQAGPLVKWEDYKRLDDLCKKLMKQHSDISCENIRLRKAGDALYESEIGYYGEQILVDPKHHSGELCRNWNAAKEGKQP